MFISHSFVEKVLACEAPGGAPATASVVIPSVTSPGVPFDVKVAVLDEVGYPSLKCDAVLRIKKTPLLSRRAQIGFETGRPAIARIRGLTISGEGLCRIVAELDGKTFFSNPTCCTRRHVPAIFWGDPHVHTVLSGCIVHRCRSLTFCYVAARFLTGLDWVGAADHVSNGRCDASKWKEQRAACHLFSDAPDFVTLLGYEASLKGGAGGDTNVYFADDSEGFVDEYEDGNVKTLCEKLAGCEFIVVPHHTTRTGKHGELPDEIYPGPELMPVLEIYSKWGASEYRGNPNPLDKIHDGPSYAVDLLQRGLILGFIAGTDTHATMPSGGGEESPHVSKLPGFTAVYAPKLSRRNVFESLRRRRCYATSGERIYLDVKVNGLDPGGCFPWSESDAPRKIAVTAAAASDISHVDIVRNGDTICSHPADSWRVSLNYTDDEHLIPHGLRSRYFDTPFVFYYVRVTCKSGARAWSSPLWLKLGEE